METILSIDLGTSYFKAALFDREMRLVGLSRLPAPVDSPHPGWREIQPEAFQKTLLELVAILQTQFPEDYSRIAGVTFSTQTNSFLLLDERDRPLTPIVLWSDERAVEGFDADGFACEGFQYFTGVPKLSPYLMLAKLDWMRRHQPAVHSSARRLCLISDFLTLWLTGRHVTEASVAGLTGLLDIHKLEWWSATCEKMQLVPECFSEVVRAGTDLGSILPEVADAWHLSPSCRVVAGCLDQYAGAIGAGNHMPGKVSETTGTVLATVRCSGVYASEIPGVYQGPSFREGLYWQMAVEGRGASLLEDFRNLQPDRPEFPVLDAEADLTPPGASGLRLIRPFQADPRDSFSGLTPEHTRGHMVRCIMEAVAFRLEEHLKRLCGEDLPASLRCCGGATRSRGWLQIKADVLNIACAPPACPEPACLGGALLAGYGMGWNTPQDWPCHISDANLIQPRPQVHEIYQAQNK